MRIIAALLIALLCACGGDQPKPKEAKATLEGAKASAGAEK